MARTQSAENILETTLFDGITLVSVLLRIGYYPEAISLASQLLIHFPQALPLHVGMGRALLATNEQGQDSLRAINHLRRVLDSDPENWRIRLETMLLYLRGDSTFQERAGQELWLAVQSAPDNRWLRDMVERLPDHPFFERVQKWNREVGRAVEPLPEVKPAELQEGDEGGLARLYLRRKMPWMAAQYFEQAFKRVPHPTARLELKTGLLLALWLDGQEKRASALASEMLLDQPQLILPRLMLTSLLAEGALKKNQQALVKLIEPVWKVDPLLERSAELAFKAGLTIPGGLWPHPNVVKALNGSSSAWWEVLGFVRPVPLRLGALDRDWLESLLSHSRELETRIATSGGAVQMYYPNREVSFNLLELDGLVVQTNPGAQISGNASEIDSQTDLPVMENQGNLQKGGKPGNRSARRGSTDLDKIAASISEVENLLYGGARSRRPSRPAPRKKAPVRGRVGVSAKGDSAHGSSRSLEHESLPLYSLDPGVIAATHSPNVIFSPRGEEDEPQGLRQSTSLIISSESALISKYGRGGYGQVKALLDELAEVMRTRGFDARLLLVDNAETLRKSGFERLDPVRGGNPEQIRNLINAALPGETAPSGAARALNTVFIIGGPDIIPFWKLPNPSFDSDKEVLSDNPYGTRDNTYLLPERIVGRLPDDSGPNGSANLPFFLQRLTEVVARQRAELITPKVGPSLPMRLIESLLPSSARASLPAIDDAIRFEQEWLWATLGAGEQFLDKGRASKLSPFFYSAEAWKDSTESLRGFMGGSSTLTCSPPIRADSFDRSLLRNSRLLHFNLHGFRDTGNWYGQSQASRLITSPSLSSLPLAFTTSLSTEVKAPGTVVYSEACYGGYLAGKGVEDSIALTLLARGAAAFVGSTVISYGSAGPELSCAGHLAYYFWRGVLKQGCSFGQALQQAKIEYARERLASGHNLTGDDAKTLLEFVLLGDPTIGLRAVSPVMMPLNAVLSNKTGNASENIQKGGLWDTATGIFEAGLQGWEEEQKLRGAIRRIWGRFARPKTHYHPVEYNKLPADLTTKIEKILAWLLPDPGPYDYPFLQTLIDLGSEPNQPRPTGRSNWPFRQPKGGTPSGFADWFLEDEPDLERSLAALQESQARLLLSGQRPILTSDGRRYQQTFHLTSDFTGEEIKVNLSKGKG